MRKVRGRVLVAAGLVAAGLMAGPACADVVVLAPVKDNTIWEDAAGATANGAGQHMFCGRSGIRGGPPRIRRALVEFDVAGAVPAGAVITSVTVTLNMSKSIAFAQSCTLTRINREWGEGASDAAAEEGDGADAVPPDATWLHSEYSSAFWPVPGGDFAPAASASIPVSGVGPYTWGPTPELTADVQSWLDEPAGNHGWVLRGNEAGLSTATRWDTREHPEADRRPALRIEYRRSCVVDFTGDGLVDFSDYLEFLVAYDAAGPAADLDGDGEVGPADYAEFLERYERGC